MLMFNDPEVIEGAIIVRLARPMNFRGSVQHLILNNLFLFTKEKIYDTRNITGILKMENDCPYDFVLSGSGELFEARR